MKSNILKPLFILAVLVSSACTGNYIDINSDKTKTDEDDLKADGYLIATSIRGLAGSIISNDVNTAQFTDALLGGPMGGYFADSQSGWNNTISNFNPTDDWTNVFMASSHTVPEIYANWWEIRRITDDEVIHAISDVLKVAAMHRVTDTYGAIPYSKIVEGGELLLPYDSQQEIYNQFFDELNSAIDVLTQNRAGSIPPMADYIYGGNVEKWCKFANSLKLRLAMRIVYADFQKAKEMAESAVNHEVGVMASNDDIAKFSSFGDKGNPLYVSVKYNQVAGSETGGDTHAAADIIAYMEGYNDPRMPKYFIQSEWSGRPYVGMRRGIVIPDLSTVGRKYSGVNLSLTSPVYWLNAAEVAFLKAEAKAIFKFDMGAGSAEDFYNEGIRLSMEQWGVSGSYSSYIAQSGSVAISYSDPATTNSYPTHLSTLNVKWDENASPNEKHERIMIQKWIANWLIGNEAWADYRRTGYPKLIPATEKGNKSNGVVDSELGARRMPYPQTEYINNNQNVRTAVSQYLNGDDNMASRVWWDCNPAIN